MLRHWWRRLSNKTSVPRGASHRKRAKRFDWSGVQDLEKRAMLSAGAVQIQINSSAPIVFRDSDGSAVRITLTGPGSGSLTLTNGGSAGGQLDTLTLNGTNALSSLQINSFGGTAPGSQINKLLINKSPSGASALGSLEILTLGLAPSGLLQANGNVGSIRIGNIASDAQVSISGNVGSFSAQAISTNTDVHFGGTLSSFTANSLAAGADVSVVDQLGSFFVYGAMESAQLLTGTAGVTKFRAGSITDSIIYSVGKIGDVTVLGDLLNTKLISNVFPGTDGVYGTKDDFPGNTDVLNQGGIASLTVFGAMSHDVVESVGAVGTVTVGSRLQSSSMKDSLVISNVTPGADGKFGTLDDVALDPGYTRDITAVMVYGPAQGNIIAANGRVVKAVSISKNEKNLFVDTPFSAIVSAPSVSSRFFAPMAAPVALGVTGANQVEQGVGTTIPLRVDLNPSEFKAFGASQIYITVYGFLNTPGTIEPNPTTWYLTPTGFENTANLPEPSASTPDQLLLPTYSLDQFAREGTDSIWTISLPVSNTIGLAFSGRILISAGIPVQAHVNPTDHTVSAPSTANPTDPATGAFTDFMEFTVNPPHYPDKPELYIDTSQVDWFGLPLTLTVQGKTHNDPTSFLGPVGVEQPRLTVNALGLSDTTNLNNYQNFINKAAQSNSRAAAFAESYTTQASGMDGGVILGTKPGSPMVIATNNIAGLTIGDIIAINGVTNNTAANGTWKVGTITPDSTTSKDGVYPGTFTILNTDGTNSTGTGTSTAGGVWYLVSLASSTSPTTVPQTQPIRLVAPKDITAGMRNEPMNSQAQVVDPLNTYFDQTIDQFFLKYFTGTITTPLVVSVTEGGSGYTAPPTVTFSAPPAGGTTATGTAIIKDGKVTGVIIKDQGSGYTSAPTVSFSGVSGSGATATVKNTATGGAQTLTLTHKNVTYNGNVVQSGNNYVMRFVQNGASAGAPTYDVLYPFFTTNLPTPNDQASDQNTGSDGTYTPLFPVADAPQMGGGDYKYRFESPSQMIFACDGAFADGALRGDPLEQELIGDFENQISAAMNRGVALAAPATGATSYWQKSDNWYSKSTGQNGVYNYWAEFFHQEKMVAAPPLGNPIKYPLAYAFAFDDQGGASSTLHGYEVDSATIKFNSWSSSVTNATTTTVSEPVLTSQTPGVGPFNIKVTATVASATQGGSTPTGTVTFFVNGVPLNVNSGQVPLPAVRPVSLINGIATFEGILPALPNLPPPPKAKDGIPATLTFVITAVYSGDASSLPSLGAGSVTRPDKQGNHANTLQLSLYSGTEGQTLNVMATATVGSSTELPPSGTVDFTLTDDSSNAVAHLGTITLSGYTATTTFDPSKITFDSQPVGALKPGTYTIQAGTNTAKFTVKPKLVATQLVFDVQPSPNPVIAGQPFPVQVSLKNLTDNLLPIYSGVVTLTISGGTPDTPGTPTPPPLTVTAAVVGGVAKFNVLLTTPGTGYQLNAQFSSVSNGNPPDLRSNAFSVIAFARLQGQLQDDPTGGAVNAQVSIGDSTQIPKGPFLVQIDDAYLSVNSAPASGNWTFLYTFGKAATHTTNTVVMLAQGKAALNQDIDDKTTTFAVNDRFNSLIQGFLNDKQEVMLIQIDQEVMQVKSINEGAAKFTVVRGQNAVPHTSKSIISRIS